MLSEDIQNKCKGQMTVCSPQSCSEIVVALYIQLLYLQYSSFLKCYITDEVKRHLLFILQISTLYFILKVYHSGFPVVFCPLKWYHYSL